MPKNKPLDEKIVEDEDYYKFGWLQVDDVKQTTTNTLKELKEIDFVKMFNKEIEKEIDKIFKKHFGGKLVENAN